MPAEEDATAVFPQVQQQLQIRPLRGFVFTLLDCIAVFARVRGQLTSPDTAVVGVLCK
jgi:hypothetical protein